MNSTDQSTLRWILASILFYVGAFAIAYSSVGVTAAAFAVVPVVAAGCLSGFYFGIGTAVALAGVNGLLFQMFGLNGIMEISRQWPGVVGSVAIGAIVGFMRDRATRELKLAEGKSREHDALLREIERRELTEKDLREKEERLKILFEHAPDGYYLSDLTGTFLDGNAAAEDLVGYKRDELIGKNLMKIDMLSVDQLPKAAKLLALNAMGRSTGPDEFTLRRKDGTTATVDIRTMPVKIAGKMVVLGIARNVSERKNLEVNREKAQLLLEEQVAVRTEELTRANRQLRDEIADRKRSETAVRENKQRLQFLLENSPGNVFIQDTELRYVWVAKPSYPFSADEYAGKTDFDLLEWEEARYLTEIKRRVIDREERVTLDMPFRIDGAEKVFEVTYEPWRDHDDVVIGIAGYVHDITERKHAEAELRKAHDNLELKVQERNEQLMKSVDALQKEIFERKRTEHALRMEMETRMRAVEELRAKEKLLIQQSRLAALGEMIGNISHQWRQPLNVVGLHIQQIPFLLEEEEIDRKQLNDIVEKTMQVVQHMSRTIDDFRNFFRPVKERIPFSIRTAVDQALSIIDASLVIHHIDVRIDESSNPEVTGFPNEYSQALLNLVINARDALSERNVLKPEIVIGVGETNGRAVVTIADNAGGISEEIIERIFDPYFSTKEQGLGTGLGLFMAKTIIEKNMGGTLSVRNTELGAEFRVEI